MNSKLEEMFWTQIRAFRLPKPEREHVFHPERKWRFDFAYPSLKLAVEVEGGTYGVSRHTTGTGFEADCEKYNEAALFGWRVLRVTGRQVKAGTAIAWLERALMTAQAPA